MSVAVKATLYFHLAFFLVLGSAELLSPSAMCRKGLAGPLTTTGTSVEDMCRSIDNNPAAHLILFGLAKCVHGLKIILRHDVAFCTSAVHARHGADTTCCLLSSLRSPFGVSRGSLRAHKRQGLGARPCGCVGILAWAVQFQNGVRVWHCRRIPCA
jgi:hypothetical protein